MGDIVSCLRDLLRGSPLHLPHLIAAVSLFGSGCIEGSFDTIGRVGMGTMVAP